MAQSDARFGYRAKLPRTDHDLSQPFGFTCAPGQLLPIWFDFATPGDTYYINHDLSFMRTAPLVAPSMIDVLVHYESFFVPIQLLYQPFENSVFSIKPIYSSLFDSTLFRNMELPFINYDNLKNSRDDQYSLKGNTHRLFDMLQCYDAYNKTGFPFGLLTYQCIFQYYYRLDDKEEFNNKAFSFDQFYDQGEVAVYDVDYIDVLHQRPWRFDYYSSIYRSPIVSNANVQSVLPAGNYTPLAESQTNPIASTGYDAPSNAGISAFSSKGVSAFANAQLRKDFNTATIRQMFANEKLAMITGRTRKNYDSQVLAHYGVDVPHDVKHDISLIGKDTFKLEIGEVTSLASTDASPLGELAGKGRAYGNGERHKFTAPCHGVVMTIFSVEPLKRYERGFNRLNSITNVLELPTPEYDRLGNMPMFRYEVGMRDSLPAQNPDDIIGWKERYYYCKRRAPRVSMAFMHQGALNIPTSNNYASYFIASKPFAYSSNNAAPQPEASSTFYITPWCMDDQMLVPYIHTWQDGSEAFGQTGENWDAKPYLQYARDPFIVDSYIKVKKVNWMSKDGEPIYD